MNEERRVERLRGRGRETGGERHAERLVRVPERERAVGVRVVHDADERTEEPDLRPRVCDRAAARRRVREVDSRLAALRREEAVRKELLVARAALRKAHHEQRGEEEGDERDLLRTALRPGGKAAHG